MDSPFKNKTEVDNHVSQLTNEEISRALKALNSPVGPVTRTTRLLYKKRLTDLMCKTLPKNKDSEQTAADIESCECNNSKSEITNGSEIVSDGVDKEKVEQPSGKCFFGVQVPAIYNKPGPHVFEEHQEMVKFLKTVQNSRFKRFQRPDEAKAFSSSCDFNSPAFIRMREDRVTQEEDLEDQLPTSPYNKESLPFAGIKCHEFVALRKALETGDVEKVKELVWSNPRYLIGTGDNPTILQEGCRYNAMHISCKSNQLESCKIIMETITNHNFYFLLYREDMPHKRQTRMDHLVDMYLNNREKGFQDTPLHFACKFGHEEIVRYLVSLQMTDREARNGAGLKPREVIGSRLNGAPKQLISSIEAALEDLYYVFVIRTEDNSEPPQVSLPFCPTQALFTPGVGPPIRPDRGHRDFFKKMFCLEDEDDSPGASKQCKSKSIRVSPQRSGGGVDENWSRSETPLGRNQPDGGKVMVVCKTPSNKRVIVLADPGSEKTLAPYVPCREEAICAGSRLDIDDVDKWEKLVNMPVSSAKEIPRKIRGIAGPMPIVTAEQFRNIVLLNHMPKRFKLKMKLIKQKDCFKGLERVCRQAARKLGISWNEYWSFLDCNVDLSSATGLKLFERHLEEIREFRNSVGSPGSTGGGDDPLSDIFSKMEIKSPTDRDCSKSPCEEKGPSDNHPPKTDGTKDSPGIYIHGDTLTRADVDAFRAIKHAEKVLPDYPCVDRWFQRVSVISEAEKSRCLDASTISHHLSARRGTPLGHLKLNGCLVSSNVKRNMRHLFENE